MKIEIIKYPTKSDWDLTKMVTLSTVGKSSTVEPTETWKVKLLKSGHSPIRLLPFIIKLTIPYFASVHLVRHHVGCEHFVRTSRTDRTSVDRNALRQDNEVVHIMALNAQALINISHARLCGQADVTTRKVWAEVCRQIVEVNPEFRGLLVPNCISKGGKCDEFNCCGINKSML